MDKKVALKYAVNSECVTKNYSVLLVYKSGERRYGINTNKYYLS